MSSLVHLKNRKIAVNSVLRSNMAFKAVAIVKIQKAHKMLHAVYSNYDLVLKQDLFSSRSVNNSKNVVNVLIGCDKGMCGDFLNNIINFFKFSVKNSNDFWCLIGEKLIHFANNKNVFSYHSAFNEFEIFNLATNLYSLLNKLEAIEFNVHYFSNYKIKKITIFNLDFDKMIEKKSKAIVEESKFFEVLSIATYLSKAIYESVLSENKQRVIMLEQAKTNAENMKHKIHCLLNRIRQDNITCELNEIVSGVL